MEHIPWENNQGSRTIIDCWTMDGCSWAVILYPNGVLHLQWIELKSEKL